MVRRDVACVYYICAHKTNSSDVSDKNQNEPERNTPVVHLNPTIGMNFLSVLEPCDLRCWNSFSMAHEAGGASTWTGQALRPFHKGRWCFIKIQSKMKNYKRTV